MENNKNISLKLIIIFVLFLVLWLITSMNPMKLNVLWFIVVLILSILFMGAISIIVYLGGVSVFKESDNKILLIKSNNKKEIIKTLYQKLKMERIADETKSFIGGL